MRDRFLDTVEDIVDVLDQLYFYWPDHIEDIWVDRAKSGTQQQLDLFVYNKDKDPYYDKHCRCRCADPIAAPKPHPQIFLCTAGVYPHRDMTAPYWGRIAAADVAGSMNGTGIFLVEHFIYSVGKPLLLCMEAQTEAAHISVGSRRCSRCFCNFSSECFLDVPSNAFRVL